MVIYAILLLVLGTLTVNCQSIRQFEVQQYISPIITPVFTISEIDSNSTTNKYILNKGLLPFVLFENNKLLYIIKYEFESYNSHKWTFYREETGPKIASVTYRPFVNEGVYEFESNQFLKFQFSRLSSSFNYSIVAFNEKIGEIIQTDANAFGAYQIRLVSNQNPSILVFIAIAIGETVRI